MRAESNRDGWKDRGKGRESRGKGGQEREEWGVDPTNFGRKSTPLAIAKIGSPCFRDIGPLEAYWDHDLGLSGSHDVIGHVTIRFPIGH